MGLDYHSLWSVWSRVPPYLMAIGLIVLPACTQTIETEPLETRIREAIIKQGGLSLKSVSCPENTPLEVGRSFECVGELDSGDALAIPVRQKDALGNVEWDVPNAKGLLNLAKMAALFQQTVQTDSGQPVVIDCGQGYRSVKPGDRFECKVTQPSRKLKAPVNKQATTKAKPTTAAKQPKQPEAIVVAIDPERNVNWQQVFPPAPTPVASANVPRSSQVSTSPATPTQARANLSSEAAKDLDQLAE